MEEEYVDEGKGVVFVDSMAREGLIKNVTFEVQRKAILYDFTFMWTQKKKKKVKDSQIQRKN